MRYAAQTALYGVLLFGVLHKPPPRTLTRAQQRTFSARCGFL